jgi:hypothetical protein
MTDEIEESAVDSATAEVLEEDANENPEANEPLLLLVKYPEQLADRPLD